MSDIQRKLSVTIDDGRSIAFNRARLTGRDTVGLLPCMFLLQIWNLNDDGFYALSVAKSVVVKSEDNTLAFGKVCSAYRYSVEEGTITDVAVSSEIGLWEAIISLSVDPGTSVSDTVRQILEASGTGMTLLSFPAVDPARERAQAFFGRAAECVNEAIRYVDARAYITEAGLCIVSGEDAAVTLNMTEADIIDTPVYVNGLLVAKTRTVGWPLGKIAQVRWKSQSWKGIITERSIEADTAEGEWQAEFVMEVII